MFEFSIFMVNLLNRVSQFSPFLRRLEQKHESILYLLYRQKKKNNFHFPKINNMINSK